MQSVVLVQLKFQEGYSAKSLIAVSIIQEIIFFIYIYVFLAKCVLKFKIKEKYIFSIVAVG